MLTLTHVLVETIVERPIVLNEHKGSAIRGAFFYALRGRPEHKTWRGFCGNQQAEDCHACPLLTTCSIASLLAQHDPTGKRGHAIAQPVIIKPPLTATTNFMPDTPFGFGLTIAGNAISFFPYMAMAIQQGMRIEGLGRRDRLNDFRKGSFQVEKLVAVHPLQGNRETLWQKGDEQVEVPRLMVTHVDVLAHAATLSPNRLTLRLLTPMQIVAQGQTLRVFRFRPFFQRLMERLITLTNTVGNSPYFAEENECQQLLALADTIHAESNTHWEKLESYSSRANHRSYLSGLMGTVTLTGNLTPFCLGWCGVANCMWVRMP